MSYHFFKLISYLFVFIYLFILYSIDFFDALVTKFGTEFAIGQPHHLMAIALVNIKQEKT